MSSVWASRSRLKGWSFPASCGQCDGRVERMAAQRASLFVWLQLVEENWTCDQWEVTQRSTTFCLFFFKVMLLLICVISALIVCDHGKASGEFTATGQSVHINDGNFSDRDHMRQEAFQQQQQELQPLSGVCVAFTVSQGDWNFSKTSELSFLCLIFIHLRWNYDIVAGE